MGKEQILTRFWRQGQRFFPAETLFFLAVWLVLMAAGRDRLFQDPGTFWHLAWGEQMLQTGQVPRVERFSFTRWGQPVVADQWLAELLMALVHRLADWEGLLLLTSTALAGLYGWMGGRLVRAGITPLWSAGILAVVFLASAHNFHVRPLTATLVFQAVWFAGLLAVDAGRTPIRRLWWFVPLSVLWSNLHGGVLAGLGTLGLCAAFWLILGPLAHQSPIRSVGQGGQVVFLVGVCGLAILINPYGMELPRTWYATLSMDLGRWIQEHRPWRPAEPAGWAAIMLFLGYVAVLVPRLRRKEFRAAWTMPIIWFLLGMQRVRNLPLFAEVTTLTLAELFFTRREVPANGSSASVLRNQVSCSGGQDRSLGAQRLETAGPPSLSGHGWQKYMIPILLVGTAIVLQIVGYQTPLLGSHWVRFSPDRWPVGLWEELRAASCQVPEGEAIFNDLDFGGWLIYFTPRWRIFIDDRCALYGRAFLEAYEQSRRGNPAQLDQWQREYGFRWALVRRQSVWDRYLASQSRWECVGRDEAAAFYQLRGH